jgi:hypothetical protein
MEAMETLATATTAAVYTECTDFYRRFEGLEV